MCGLRLFNRCHTKINTYCYCVCRCCCRSFLSRSIQLVKLLYLQFCFLTFVFFCVIVFRIFESINFYLVSVAFLLFTHLFFYSCSATPLYAHTQSQHYSFVVLMFFFASKAVCAQFRLAKGGTWLFFGEVFKLKSNDSNRYNVCVCLLLLFASSWFSLKSTILQMN